MDTYCLLRIEVHPKAKQPASFKDMTKQQQKTTNDRTKYEEAAHRISKRCIETLTYHINTILVTQVQFCIWMEI